MPSFTDKVAKQLVRASGIKRRLAQTAETENDPERLAKLVRKLRRFDRSQPPGRLRRRWNVETIAVEGHALHVVADRAGQSRRVILYLHGGGYIFGPFVTDWASCRRVASSTGCDFAVLDYPKVPEHEAPQTIAVTMQAYAVLEGRYGATSIILVGTSAGGGLALALMAQLRDEGRELPAMAILISPGVDVTLAEPIGDLEQHDVLLSVAHVRSAGRLYAGDLGAHHPSVSPLFGNLGGLPPLWVFAATSEILYPSLRTFVQTAQEAGTAATLVVGEGQQHTWPLAPTPDGRKALREIAEIIGNGG